MIFDIFIGGAGLKVIGIDLHGTITPHSLYNPDVKLPWWLFWILVPLIRLSKPRKEVVEKMQLMEGQGYRFIVVTATPNQFFWFTKRLLKSHHVPFEDLSCVDPGKGTNERKLKVIKEKGMEIYIDSDNHVLRFMERNSVKAVSSLDQLN